MDQGKRQYIPSCSLAISTSRCSSAPCRAEVLWSVPPAVFMIKYAPGKRGPSVVHQKALPLESLIVPDATRSSLTKFLTDFGASQSWYGSRGLIWRHGKRTKPSSVIWIHFLGYLSNATVAEVSMRVELTK